ncbi:MAG: hypothetical protein AVDCRST_MAG68-2778 [uncultured Gemmatimonadetes bacterium]|uniref:Uncharacterized protein n=1 Tax=uncultured Gemmatimonadota bacterium TaxID=203437 RepID=A0A6J4L386_9BACT|nr:MAG: hypothetical protein AVDCRST_MAG68-2778 [uncultured Gemmatimonadota bacterium]
MIRCEDSGGRKGCQRQCLGVRPYSRNREGCGTLKGPSPPRPPSPNNGRGGRTPAIQPHPGDREGRGSAEAASSHGSVEIASSPSCLGEEVGR